MEIVLDDPAGHRLFFTPEKVWMDPVVDWLIRKK
jgi:hypothetical protein